MIDRPEYMNRLISFKDKDLIYTGNPSNAFGNGVITLDNYSPRAKSPNIAKVFKETGSGTKGEWQNI